MIRPIQTFIVAAMAGAALGDGLYGGKSPVLQVTAKTYDSLIAQSNHTSIVEFYAPWCGHCQSLKPAYEKAAKNLAGLAKVAAVNCDEESNKPLCAQFGVQGFPTLKIVKPGKKPGRPIVEDYQGPREAKALVAAVTDKLTNHVKRLQTDTLNAWVEEGTRPKAILFTEKSTTALLVKALAIDFLGVIDFAQVRSKEQVAVDQYEVARFPTLFLLNGDGTKIGSYDGEISKENLVEFLSQVASPNPDPAPKNAKSSTTKKSKTASASSAFSKASAAHKASEFEEHLEHASTIVLGDDGPVESPLPIVENSQKPVSLPDVPPPLPTLATSSELRSACLQQSSTHCVLILLPKQENAKAQISNDAIEGLSAFAAIEQKYSKRKANIFPAYAIPSTNEDGSTLRQELDLKSDADIEVVVMNMKKGWWRKYSAASFDGKSVENFMDDIRFGEGVKQKLPANFLSTNAADVPEPEVGGTASENTLVSTEEAPTASPTHDEL